MRPAISGRNALHLFLLFPAILLVGCGGSSTHTAVVPPPAYFGLALPGETPAEFAPEKLKALDTWVEATAFSPDGTLFFASVGSADWSTSKLYLSTFANGAWTPFVEPPFLADFAITNEPVFLADGKTLTFTGKKGTDPAHLWSVTYANNTWGTPVVAPSPINDDANTWRGSYTTDGTFYFGSERIDPGNNYGIYKAVKDATQNWVVSLVGAPISTETLDYDPCVAPDGRFLVFASGRNGQTYDLYVSFRDAQGNWGEPINMGPDFNLTLNSVGNAVQEYGAHLSPDGNYLFYTRHTTRGTLQGNQIMWVAVSAIDKLKP